ncbi:MAG: hypothetical protein HZB22_00410 [Deltaproteobacteria bacterium]|nr:hypothetical protein [Deltaproteobacteria bacterium]
MGACRNGIVSLALFLILSVFLCPPLNSHALETQGREDTGAKTKKERLVARDIGFVVSKVRWCGNDRLLVYGEKGLRLVDLKGQWTVVSTKRSDYPLNCTRDGKWVLYLDWKSSRIDRGRIEPPEGELEGEAMWQGYVEDLYRYEVSTGKVEKFATRRDRPEFADVVSPDGAKAFLGGRHDTPFKMPEPKWEVRWLENEWTHIKPTWLADSSGIVAMAFDENNNASLGVEIFGENGWSRVFIPGRDLGIKGQPGSPIAIKNKTFFLRSVEPNSEVKMGSLMGRTRYYFYTCDIKQGGLDCKEILEFDLKFTDISYAVLSDGDMVYRESDDWCIRRFSQSRAKTECIVDGADLGRFYGLSPDGTRIVYQRYWKKNNKGIGYDLYMMEIN